MGDLATIDADGYLTVVGRTSDLIIRGGKNISAAQVEDEVGVASRGRAVRGGRDARRRRSASGCACSSSCAPARDRVDARRRCSAHLARRGTGKELWPERLVVLDALPRSSGGKVAKGELAERAAGSDAIPPASRPPR